MCFYKFAQFEIRNQQQFISGGYVYFEFVQLYMSCENLIGTASLYKNVYCIYSSIKFLKLNFNGKKYILDTNLSNTSVRLKLKIMRKMKKNH